MKKILLIVGVALTLLIMPSVKAVTFKDGNTEYSLTEIENVRTYGHAICPSAENSYFYTIAENGNLIFKDSITDELYAINPYSESCKKMTSREVLDFYSEYYNFSSILLNDDYMIVKIKKNCYYNYVITEDEAIAENKDYYKIVGNEYTAVSSPIESELSIYYEEKCLTNVKNVIIDPNETYYNIFGIPAVKVENPTIDDIEKYGVEITDNKEEVTNVAQLSRNIFEPIITASADYHIISSEAFGTYILVDNGEETVVAYNVDGTVAQKLTDIVPYGCYTKPYIYKDAVLGVICHPTAETSVFRLYNSDFKLLYEENMQVDMLSSIRGNFLIEDSRRPDQTIIRLFNIYKVVSGNTQTYNNDNLVITFSGNVENLETVKVNDVIIDESKYTITSGSTIVTLKKEYLQTLDKGTYTLKVSYSDGASASASFSVTDGNPKTGDVAINFMLLLSILLVGIVIYKLAEKKGKRFN